jgi:hypothetical protein
MITQHNTDNYNNDILEVYHHDHYTAYELVKDFCGYYVNLNSHNNNDYFGGKREIIAKFQNSNYDNSNNYFFARLFWDNLVNYGLKK